MKSFFLDDDDDDDLSVTHSHASWKVRFCASGSKSQHKRLQVVCYHRPFKRFSESKIHFPIAQLCWWMSRERRSWHKSSSSFGGAMIFLFVLSSETRARYQSTRQYWVDTDAIAARLIQREAKNGKRRIFCTNLDSRRILKWSRPSEFAHENRERNFPIRGGGKAKAKRYFSRLKNREEKNVRLRFGWQRSRPVRRRKKIRKRLREKRRRKNKKKKEK